MTIQFFGFEKAKKKAKNQVECPVGNRCSHCDEPFIVDDRGYSIPIVGSNKYSEYHEECFLYQLLPLNPLVYGIIDEKSLTKRKVAQEFYRRYKLKDNLNNEFRKTNERNDFADTGGGGECI